MMSLFKSVAASLSVFTMCLAPVAQGAAQKQNQSQLISQFLKESGVTTKKMTIAEYWRMVRHTYPDSTRLPMDRWVTLNRNELMPSVTATSFKDGQGRVQTRLTMSQKGQSMTVTFIEGDELQVKMNDVKFTGNSFFDIKTTMARMIKEDPGFNKMARALPAEPLFSKNIVMSYAELEKLTPRQRAEYFIKIRQTMAAAQNIVEAAHGSQALNDLNSKYEWVVRSFLGQDAGAQSKAKPKAKASSSGGTASGACVVAGYVSQYGSGARNSCGGVEEGAADLKVQIGRYEKSCPASARIPCNPIVYGFTPSGQPHCVPNQNIKFATEKCNSMSPLDGVNDKKRIVESFMKTAIGKDVTLNPREDGKISPEERAQIAEYLAALKSLIQEGMDLCDKDANHQKIQSARPDQVSACQALRVRLFDLETFAANITPPLDIPPPAPQTKDCSFDRSGSVLAQDGKSCICPERTVDGSITDPNGQTKPACVPIVTPVPQKKEKEEKSSWGMPLLIGGGILALGVGAYFLFKKDKKETPVLTPPTYTPPVPDLVTPPICTPPAIMSNGVCTTPTVVVPPVIVPPPPACLAPMSMVNGVCTAPTPVAPPPSEGGAGKSGSSSGGVR